MAGGIDVSQRKPRRLRGTPALKFNNRLAVAILAFGTISGCLLFSQISLGSFLKAKTGWDILQLSESEKERRALMSLGQRKTGQQILEIIEERERKEKQF